MYQQQQEKKKREIKDDGNISHSHMHIQTVLQNVLASTNFLTLRSNNNNKSALYYDLNETRSRDNGKILLEEFLWDILPPLSLSLSLKTRQGNP